MQMRLFAFKSVKIADIVPLKNSFNNPIAKNDTDLF